MIDLLCFATNRCKRISHHSLTITFANRVRAYRSISKRDEGCWLVSSMIGARDVWQRTLAKLTASADDGFWCNDDAAPAA